MSLDSVIVPKRLSVVRTDLKAVERLDPETRKKASAVSARIASLAKRLPPGWPIGLEKIMLDRPLPDVSAGVAVGRLKQIGVRFVDEARVEIHDRPPSEYGVISLFKRMEEGPLAPENVLTAVRQGRCSRLS